MQIPVRTLQAISKRAGVSRMSVSRALGNKPGISQELRERILKIAQELNYRPNPLIAALMINVRASKLRRPEETGVGLAFVERADQTSEVKNEHFLGAAEVAEELGYRLEQFIIGKAGLSATRVNEILVARGIQGVLIAPLPEDHGTFALDWPKFCTVAIEYTFVQPLFDRVVHDSYASLRIILEKCRTSKFRRVGLLLTTNGYERTEGLNGAAFWDQKSKGFFAPIPPLYLDFWSNTTFLRWFNSRKPEVIITSSILLPYLLNFLEKRRVQVPNDVSIVNVNVLSNSEISGIDQNNKIIGATAVRLLVDKINRNDRGVPIYPNTVLTPGIWRDGQTFCK